MYIATEHYPVIKPIKTLVSEFKGDSPENRVLQVAAIAPLEVNSQLALTPVDFTSALNQPKLLAHQFDQFGCARGWVPSTQYVQGYENRPVYSYDPYGNSSYRGTQQVLVTIPQAVCVAPEDQNRTIQNYNQQQYPIYQEPTYSQPQDTTIYPQHGNRRPGDGYGNHHGRQDRKQRPTGLSICAKFPVGDARIRTCANF